MERGLQILFNLTAQKPNLFSDSSAMTVCLLEGYFSLQKLRTLARIWGSKQLGFNAKFCAGERQRKEDNELFVVLLLIFLYEKYLVINMV